MRILMHDFAGHAFPVQLSREFARRGHDVLHVHCASVTGAKGALAKTATDPVTFDSCGIELDETFEKYSGVKRIRQEREYGHRVVARFAEFRPDVVVSSNTPLFAQHVLINGVDRAGTGFVFWQQDVVGVAMEKIIRNKIPGLGAMIGKLFPVFERSLVRRAREVVVITEDFVPLVLKWGVHSERVSVIENWAPLDELVPAQRENAWAKRHGLLGKKVFLYAGTLGLKHNPALLFELARAFRERDDVQIVVISEGMGAEWLSERLQREPLSNLSVLPYQPYDELPQVLASGDVLVVILEPDAGIFSVPSKVLSYLCAGRPVLGAMPLNNLAALTVQRTGAGVVASSDDVASFVKAAGTLVDDAEARATMGACARKHALDTFDIARIGDRFEEIVARAGAPATIEHRARLSTGRNDEFEVDSPTHLDAGSTVRA